MKRMLDMKFVRANPSAVAEMLAKRNSQAPLDEIVKLDVEWRREKA